MFLFSVSRLKQHNRLSSGFVFPGQLLKIPPPEPEKPLEQNTENRKSSGNKTSSPIIEEPEIFDLQFVKINVKFITDGKGIVSGSLLLTPKTVRTRKYLHIQMACFNNKLVSVYLVSFVNSFHIPLL